MFGRQAIRLLRETWGGILAPDAEGAYRERGAKLLAEELYAMFDDDIPLVHDGPVTINKGSNAAPLTINNHVGGPSMVVGGDFELGGDFSIHNGDFIQNGGDYTFDGGDSTFTGGDFSFVGSTFNFEVPDTNITITDPATGEAQTLAQYITSQGTQGSGGGTTVFLGRVVSGSGATYIVDLFGHGSGRAATARVEATVPQIYEFETIPAGTWLAAVHKFVDIRDPADPITTYEFQPPIWMAPS